MFFYVSTPRPPPPPPLAINNVQSLMYDNAFKTKEIKLNPMAKGIKLNHNIYTQKYKSSSIRETRYFKTID